MRKLVTGLVVALGLTGAGAVGPVQAHDPAPDQASVQVSVGRSITPAVGRYRGHDRHDRLITFTYTRANGIRHFRINHELVGRAVVADGTWPRTCAHGFCTWGTWITKRRVTGYWLRDPESRHRLGGGAESFSVWNPKTL